MQSKCYHSHEETMCTLIPTNVCQKKRRERVGLDCEKSMVSINSVSYLRRHKFTRQPLRLDEACKTWLLLLHVCMQPYYSPRIYMHKEEKRAYIYSRRICNLRARSLIWQLNVFELFVIMCLADHGWIPVRVGEYRREIYFTNASCLTRRVLGVTRLGNDTFCLAR